MKKAKDLSVTELKAELFDRQQSIQKLQSECRAIYEILQNKLNAKEEKSGTKKTNKS